MTADIFKFYSIFLCCILITLKIMNLTVKTAPYRNGLVLVPIVLTGLTYLLNLHVPELAYIASLLLLWISLSIFTKLPQRTFIAVTIAFGISYSLYAISCFIILVIFFSKYLFATPFPNLLLTILSSIFQTVLTIALLRIKRFKRGMPFLFSTSVINIATNTCLLLISCSMYFSSTIVTHTTRIVALLLFISVLTFLIHWWQAQITKSYKRSLEQRELESLRIELQEKDKQIAELKAESIKFGDITHEYNKLIPPLADAVCEYLEADFSDAEATRSKGQVLSAQLHMQSEKLAQTTAMLNAKKYKQHDTGIGSLDTYLNFYEKQATEENVEFSVHAAVNLSEQVPKNISVDDFTHLVVNLLSNAFIAVTDCSNPTVQLQFYPVGKHFVIEVSDNGIPFEVDSLVNYGLERITTHEDTGGSGVGLVAIWNIKETCGATLHIEEYEASAPFSKKISLIFNKKNLYSIRTWRKEEILQRSKRIDLQVYDFEQ